MRDSLNRIKTVLVYSYFHITHSMETWVDLFWFSSISVVVFGLLAQYLGGLNSQETTAVIFGLIMWEMVRVVQYGITVGMMWDVWSKNFSSLFVTPLTMTEFVLGQLISSLVKSISVSALLSVVCWFLFGLWAPSLGFVWIPYFLLLSIMGWATGMVIMALIIRFGTDIQSLAWGLIFMFQPISAIVYPVSALPDPVEWVAYLSPMTYVTESLRHQLATGDILWKYLALSAVVNGVYVLIAVGFLRFQFNWAKRTGAFARMEA